jgi:hypothetical protein
MRQPEGTPDPLPSTTASHLALRASDADRERVVERLRAHAAEGRLDVQELEQRLAAAFAARTHGELEPLLADLPAHRPRSRRRPAYRAAALGPWLRLSVLLIGIWALSGGGYFWPVWPMLGTFIGMVGPGYRGGAPGCHRHRRLAGGARPTTGA